ncbi:hypothetical protein OG21DRAFT_1512516 [Imleria badia]|nr:hypothetical protein OG21DRAFT_1512516 [Imleria badia]
MDSDPFFQWIDVPEDLPPVDEDVYGLKDISSLGFLTDFNIDAGSGLLLGPDICHQGADTFHAILSPNFGQNASLPTVDSSPSYRNASLFPPVLSPDTSPTSVASSPWLRTPETDPLLADIPHFTPVDTLWDIDTAETEQERCSMISFIDQSGNILDDIPASHIQDMRLEDIACTPASLPSVLPAPCTPVSNTPTFVISFPPGASTYHQTEAVPPGQTDYTSLAPSSPCSSQPLFGFSPVIYNSQEIRPPAYSLSPSLSPLTTLSFFSQSPSASQNSSPLTNCSPLSPALSLGPLSNGNEKVDSVLSTPTRVTSVKLRAKRNADHLDEDEDAPPWKISRRSKAKSVDEEEWSPGFERVKRPRAVSSSQSTREMMISIPPDESPDSATNKDSGGHSDTTTTCQICGQGFTRPSDYIRHVENSAGHPETRKVWRCTYCDSVLGRKDALGRHIKTLHPGEAVIIPEGIPVNQLPEGQMEPSMQRMGQRKMVSRRQGPSRKDTRRYR